MSDSWGPPQRIIVIEVHDNTVGLIVDAISEVIHLNAEDVEIPPEEMSIGNDFLWGVGKFQNRLLILLDPEKFLDLNETHDLKKVASIAKEMNSLKEDINEVKLKVGTKNEN